MLSAVAVRCPWNSVSAWARRVVIAASSDGGVVGGATGGAVGAGVVVGVVWALCGGSAGVEGGSGLVDVVAGGVVVDGGVSVWPGVTVACCAVFGPNSCFETAWKTK